MEKCKRLIIIADKIGSVRNLVDQDFLTIANVLKQAFNIDTNTTEIGEAFDCYTIVENENAKSLGEHIHALGR